MYNLWKAALKAMFEAARTAVFTSAADIDSDTGMTDLHTAIEQGNFVKACYLINQGADVNKKDHRGDAPLCLLLKKKTWADADRHLKVVKLLIERGASVDEKNEPGHTTLHLAVMNNCPVDIIKLLLDHGAAVNESTPHHGNTALHFASTAATTALLLERGADINGENSHGETALHAAARAGHIEVVQLLLDRGADISRSLQNAIVFRKPNVAKRLIHEHLARGTSPEGDNELITEASSNTPEFKQECKRFVQQRLQLLETEIQFCDRFGNSVPVKIKTLIGPSAEDQIMRYGVTAEAACEALQKSIASKAMQFGRSHYSVFDTLKALRAQIAQKLKVAGEIEEFKAIDKFNERRELRGEEGIALMQEQQRKGLHHRRTPCFATVLSPSRNAYIDDSPEPCNPDTNTHHLKLL